MSKSLDENAIKYIILRLIENANAARDDFEKDRTNSFEDGHSEAYYEMLDVIKTELSVRDVNLSEYGLDVDLESKYA